MAEAEDVITDAALRATNLVQAAWRRHRARHAATAPPPLVLADVAQRLDLLIVAVFGRACPLRTAQAPARSTWLARRLQRQHQPRVQAAVPATDGSSIWLPAETGLGDATLALARFRTVALQQAMRAVRGSAAGAGSGATPLAQALYLLIEAHAADAALAQLLPGLQAPLQALRTAALQARPALSSFPAARQPLEAWARRLMATACGAWSGDAPHSPSPGRSRQLAHDLAHQLQRQAPLADQLADQPLFQDWWTGALLAPDTASALAPAGDPACGPEPDSPIRSARLARSPQVRDAPDGEDDAQPGAWMIQASAPHEVAEDPFGLQRPGDRDAQTPADGLAESLAELAQARLVATPGRPQEVLLSDDPPGARTPQAGSAGAAGPDRVHYPEWDHRLQAYGLSGATVHLLPAAAGPQPWVDQTLAEHHAMLALIRRRFEMLRGRRTPLRRQRDGDDIDLEACIDARADLQAGQAVAQALYRSQQRTRRDMAILLLIDTSGSTDGWVSSGRRIIDVEREALLLVCIALGAMGEPYAVQAFSGHGPQAVTVRTLKRFAAPYDNSVARRIAALEPEQSTRAGAAIRHASATLMQEPAAQRLLLLLSDGKPNDVDVYEGRYGVEDMRRAVIEARLQGIAPFCLTVDRQAAAYLPAVFGSNQYAMLATPARLPTVLLDWMHRLVTAG
ncbi:MAG: VWA domain-containing protein [Pseudomonadota bacterium]